MKKQYKVVMASTIFFLLGLDVSLLGTLLLVSPLAGIGNSLIKNGSNVSCNGINLFLNNKKRKVARDMNDLVDLLARDDASRFSP